MFPIERLLSTFRSAKSIRVKRVKKCYLISSTRMSSFQKLEIRLSHMPTMERRSVKLMVLAEMAKINFWSGKILLTFMADLHLWLTLP